MNMPMKARRIHKHRLYGALHYGTRVLLKTSKLFKDFINVSVTALYIEDHSGETAVLIEIWNPTIHDAEQYMEILIFLYIVIYYCFPYSVSYGGSCVRNWCFDRNKWRCTIHESWESMKISQEHAMSWANVEVQQGKETLLVLQSRKLHAINRGE